MPFETDGDGGQASLIYFIPISERLFINGFADLNASEVGSDRWGVEPQLNFKLNPFFMLVAEYRFNGFEQANPNLDGQGLALGVRIDY